MPARSPQPNVNAAPQRSEFSLAYWALIVLTGAGSGLAAGLLMKLLRLVQHVAWNYRSGDFLDAVAKADPYMRVGILSGTGVFVALVLFVMQHYASKHTGEVEATIWFREGRLPPIRTFIKAVFSIVIVGLGASLGREAAPKQLGTLIGSLLASWRHVSPTKRRLLAACGAGAGIASVYNVPFGGALFTLEVLLGSLSLPLVAPAFIATLSGTAMGWLLMPDQPIYRDIPSTQPTAGLIVWAIVFAPFAGGASALFIKLIAFAAAHRPKGANVLIAAILVFAALGGLSIPYPQLLGNGKNVVELAALGKLALPVLVALMILKPIATAACLGTGAPGGLFTPTLTFGALLGGVLGSLWSVVWPHAPAGAFALIGAAAVLAGTTKGPVSALILMMELTHRLDGLIVPLLIAIALATTIAHLLDPRSTYTSRLNEPRSLPLRAAKPDASIPDEPAPVSAALRYKELLKIFAYDEMLADVRVVDDSGSIIGRIGRADVVRPSARFAPLDIATAGDFVAAD